MKKILFVVDERKMGGTSIVLEQIIKSISKSEFKCDILVLHNIGDRLSNLNNGNLIFATSFFDVVDIPFMSLVKKFKITKIIKKLYLIFLMKTGLVKKKIIKERRKIIKDNYDVEISFKDPGHRYLKSYTDAVNKYNKIVAISKNVSNNFNKIYHKNEITIIINNLVDISKLKKIKKVPKEKYNLELVTVGRLHKVKGYDRLLKVINRLKKEGLFDDSILKIVGDGEESSNLKKYVEEHDLVKEVKFYGQQDDPWQYLQNGDLFIVSSYSESFALTVIESLSIGIPVLSTEYSSAHELMQNNYNSLIVENSITGLYNGLKKVISNSKYLKGLRENTKNYSYDNCKIIKSIESLLRGDKC